MDDIHEKNAQITSTSLGLESHGIMTFMLHLDYDGTGQGAGGYSLDGGDPRKYCTTRFLRAILNSSREGEICLDLFAGSGFSLIACHKLKRQWRGMEMDAAYVDVCVKRWEAYSGLKAKRLSEPKNNKNITKT